MLARILFPVFLMDRNFFTDSLIYDSKFAAAIFPSEAVGI